MFKTHMWRECPFIRGDKAYRFQTDDPHIHKKMRQRKDFKLAIWGLNKKLWVYVSDKNTLEKAKRTLGNLTHGKVNKSAARGEYWAESTPYIAPK
tara:strand:+ start:819 stop:1103 length:285 start_codon:yes stop_codon:yes gene_type:complete